MSEEAEPFVEIFITGKKVVAGGATGGGNNAATILSYSQQPMPDVFEQVGGEETVTTVTFALIDGNIVVRLPGYDFPFKVPAASWKAMSDGQKGAFIKLMTEFHQSPELVSFLNHLQTEGASIVEIHFDDKMHRLNGTLGPFPVYGVPEAIQWSPAGEDETDLETGTRVIITIDSRVVKTDTREFAESLLHALAHPYYGLSESDEFKILDLEDKLYNQIFNTPGERETRPSDYYEGTTITGSRHDDNVSGGTGNDTLAGLSGHDILNGGDGNDLVMGGAGMDRLSGGTGDNILAGGLDADTYSPAWGAGADYVVELGGVDRMDLSAFTIGDCLFTRLGDTLSILLPSGTSVLIENQWLAGTKVEQFAFADGTFASSYIEYLAEGGGGVCYDEYGQQIFCSPFGMPVVLDLDGDGIELVPFRASRARFDMDGDGAGDRLGWVGRDDGILALDRNGNGRVDDFSEMSFVQDFRGAATDLEGLFAYDSNRDGFLTAADERFAEFLVWRDSNGNGKSEKQELFTLDDLGIVSISLERSNINPLRPDDEANQVLATSAFRTSNGAMGQVADVALFVALRGADCGCHPTEPSGAATVMPYVQFEGLIP